jgi:tetratricopeptide (TPR) repeat protein
MRGLLTGLTSTLALIIAVAAPMAAVRAQQGGDLQAQILYAYQTEDLNELSGLQSRLRTQVADDATDAALRYHLAHADYRYARLVAATQPRAAAQAADECIGMLKPLLRKDGHNVEALILQSRCDSALAATGPLDAVLVRRRAAERLDEALQLAPRNPRALLAAALRDLDAGAADPAARARGLAALREAADLFTRDSATSPEVPGWGDGEAWVALGRELMKSGDVLGARNWIERALIASPDFKDARRARAELAGH